MKFTRDPHDYSKRHTARGDGIAKFLVIVALCTLGIYGLVSYTRHVSAEDGRPGYISPAVPPAALPLPAPFATYRGHRIYYSHHRRYFIYNHHRHYLWRGAT
jgi:hypothetical protein